MSIGIVAIEIEVDDLQANKKLRQKQNKET